MKRIVFILLAIIALTIYACSENKQSATEQTAYLELFQDDDDNPYLIHLDSMPNGCKKIKIISYGPLSVIFNDSNHVQLNAATELGIHPISDLKSAWNIKHPIVKIESCREYFVDKLTHSYPFLVPEAAQLLRDIGSRFNDTLKARGGGAYRIKVTSVLRTPATIASLRRINRNAVDTSAHQFATTFDISFGNFICDSVTTARSQEDLKNLLAEILYNLRKEKRCYVKYERKQSCFHITARPVAD